MPKRAGGLLNDKQETFLQWLLLPPHERTPRTQAEWAVEHDVSVASLSSWKREVAFKAEYERRWRRIAGHPERAKQIIDKLHEKGMQGDTNAMKLWLEWAREFTPRQELFVQGADDLRDLSDEELAQRVLKVVPDDNAAE